MPTRFFRALFKTKHTYTHAAKTEWVLLGGMKKVKAHGTNTIAIIKTYTQGPFCTFSLSRSDNLPREGPPPPQFSPRKISND